jgi:plasmid replication initiation protein
MLLSQIIKPKKPHVYKSNKLNNANFGDLSLNDYQVYLYLVSKICGINDNLEYLHHSQLKREYTLTAKEFSLVFNVDMPHSYRILRKAVVRLMKTDIKVERLELKELWQINICSMAKYNDKEGYITIEFTDRIMQYLAQVKANFTHYNIKEIANFRSIYTTRLYELVIGYKNQKYFEKSVEDLRDVFAVGEKLKAYKDLKVKTFEHGCNEINKMYNINLRFKEIKKGRKVDKVQFLFDSTAINEIKQLD